MAGAWRLPAQDAWVFGGEVAAVEAALDAWEIPRRRDPLTGEVTHPALVYIVDATGQIAYAATGGAEAIAELLRRL
jgi:cytochrome oxidase Cu insertion factor (SCO1/SenC/PrrC family)